jgi:hypothetical protein
MMKAASISHGRAWIWIVLLAWLLASMAMAADVG